MNTKWTETRQTEQLESPCPWAPRPAAILRAGYKVCSPALADPPELPGGRVPGCPGGPCLNPSVAQATHIKKQTKTNYQSQRFIYDQRWFNTIFISLLSCKYMWPVWETVAPGVWFSELRFLALAHRSALCEDGSRYRSSVLETVSSPSCIPPPPCSACASAGQSERQRQESVKYATMLVLKESWPRRLALVPVHAHYASGVTIQTLTSSCRSRLLMMAMFFSSLSWA